MTRARDRQVDRRIAAHLDDLIAAMREGGYPTDAMQRFFDVGEWLLCFEGAWFPARGRPDHPLRRLAAFQALEEIFAHDLP